MPHNTHSLVLTSALFPRLLAAYNAYLMRSSRLSQLRTWHGSSDLVLSFFIFSEFTAALFLAGSLPNLLAHERSIPPRLRLRHITAGVAVGFLTFVISFWTLLGGRQSPPLGVFFADHFYSPSAAALAILLVFLLPVASEMFCRGVVLRRLLESMPFVPALLLSTILFAWTWTLFNSVVGLALGVLTGTLFFRTRSVLACAVADSIAVICIVSYQIYYILVLNY